MRDFLAVRQLRDQFGLLMQPLRREQTRYGDADHLVGGVAKDTTRTGVPREHRAVEALRDDGIVAVLDDGGGERGGQIPLLRLRNIARYFRHRHNGAAGIAHRRQRDRHVDGGAVLSDSTGDEMRNGLSQYNSRDEHPFLMQPVGREQAGDGTADHLRGAVAEQPLGTGIPGGHRAVEALGDDGVICIFDDRDGQCGVGRNIGRPLGRSGAGSSGHRLFFRMGV